MKRTILTALVLMLPLLATACNTISGAGEDISAGGKAITGTSNSTKNNMESQ